MCEDGFEGNLPEGFESNDSIGERIDSLKKVCTEITGFEPSIEDVLKMIESGAFPDGIIIDGDLSPYFIVPRNTK